VNYGGGGGRNKKPNDEGPEEKNFPRDLLFAAHEGEGGIGNDSKNRDAQDRKGTDNGERAVFEIPIGRANSSGENSRTPLGRRFVLFFREGGASLKQGSSNVH